MTSLFGLKVKLPTGTGCKQCGADDVCTISPPTKEHFADLKCSGCGVRRGYLSKRTARLLEMITSSYGAPSTPLVLRRPASGAVQKKPPTPRRNTPAVSRDEYYRTRLEYYRTHGFDDANASLDADRDTRRMYDSRSDQWDRKYGNLNS